MSLNGKIFIHLEKFLGLGRSVSVKKEKRDDARRLKTLRAKESEEVRKSRTYKIIPSQNTHREFKSANDGKLTFENRAGTLVTPFEKQNLVYYKTKLVRHKFIKRKETLKPNISRLYSPKEDSTPKSFKHLETYFNYFRPETPSGRVIKIQDLLVKSVIHRSSYRV